MAAITKLADLTEEERQSLEGWLEGFTRTWSEGVLDDAISELRSRPDCPWRFLALNQMVKIDLVRQWQLGRNVTLSTYIERYPELGGAGGIAADVIWAEIKAKSRAGLPVDLEAYVRDYPNQSAELRSLAGRAGAAAASSTRKMRQQGPTEPAPASPTTHLDPRTTRPSAPAHSPSTSTLPQALLSGQFGRYRIEKQLGQGGMGSVYMAYDTELDRHVALKVPQFAPEDGTEVLERFKHEARAAATLRHTNLCQVYDVGAIDGTFFLTMEFIAGKSLESYVAQQHGVSPRFIALVMTKLARALKTAHAKNVIHRDLKPSNIMIRDADGTLEPVIVDFGLARRIDAGNARLTQAGLVIGTWQYMTPEQLCGEPDALGPGCDIYALGVIMYELMTGRLPYDAPGQVVRGNPTVPSSIRPGLDQRLEAICLRAMAVSARERYTSMGDLVTALTEYLRPSSERAPEVRAVTEPASTATQEPISEQPKHASGLDAPPVATPRTPIYIAVGAVAVASVLSGAWAFWGRPASVKPTVEPSASNRQVISKAMEPAQLLTPESDPELLLENAWRAIRAGTYADARTPLDRYLDQPRSSKKEEARVLLADLDHVTSKTEARNRAKAQGNEQLKERLDHGVNDLVDVIRTPELRDAYAAQLIEAFEQENKARLAKVAFANTRSSVPKKARGTGGPSPKNASASTPRAAGPFQPFVRTLEPNFKFLYGGVNFDGWEASAWHIALPAKGVNRDVSCPPSNVVHKAGFELVSNPVDGHLRTSKLYQLASFKFDYMIAASAPPPQVRTPKGAAATKNLRNTSASPIRRPHVSTTLYLDQPLKIGNTAQCGSITLYLAPVNAGRLLTQGHGNKKDEAFYDPTAAAGHSRGEWSEIEIRCGERELRFLLNGVEVNRLETARRLNCKVGFSFDAQEVHFANIRLAEGGAAR